MMNYKRMSLAKYWHFVISTIIPFLSMVLLFQTAFAEDAWFSKTICGNPCVRTANGMAFCPDDRPCPQEKPPPQPQTRGFFGIKSKRDVAARQAAIARQNEIKRNLELARLTQAEYLVKAAQQKVQAYDEKIQEEKVTKAKIQSERTEFLKELKIYGEERATEANKKYESLCFSGETLIAVIDFLNYSLQWRQISVIKKGDWVVSNFFGSEGETCELAQVQDVMESTTDHLLRFNMGEQVIRVTADHPFYVPDQQIWIKAQNLLVGDQFQSLSGMQTVIEKIEAEDGYFTVYNLDIKKNHNYFANDVLVHNCNSLTLLAGTIANFAAEEGALLGAVEAVEVVLGGPTVFLATIAAGLALHEATKTDEENKDSSPAREEKIYHRKESPTQTPEDSQKMEESGELWGRAPRDSFIPTVQAHKGPLPEGERGIEFTTEIPPNSGGKPFRPDWSGAREGVGSKTSTDGDFATIPIKVIKNTQK